MTKVHPAQLSFNAGEFSPRMVARTDFNKYSSGCAQCENFIPLPQGGLMRRPGTRYVATSLASGSAQSVLLPFQFSVTQTYVLELGQSKIRFFTDEAVVSATNITGVGIVNGNFNTDISDWADQSGAGSSISHDAVNLRMNLTSNGTTDAHAEDTVTYVTSGQAHSRKFRVLGAPGDEVKLRVGTSSTGNETVDDVIFGVGWHVYTFEAGATTIYVQFLHSEAKVVQIDEVEILDDEPLDVGSPFTWFNQSVTFDRSPPHFAQTADVVYFGATATNRSSETRCYKLKRIDASSWSMEEVAFQDGPYLDENLTATTFTAASATGNDITITASAVTGINGGDGFKSTDVGRLVRIDDGSAEPGWGVISAFTDTTHVDVHIKRTMVTTAETGWSLGVWSDTTGWPRRIGFFEQRLVYAQTNYLTQTFWMSQSADIENFRQDSWVSSAIVVEDDDALAFSFAADQVNVITWVSPGKQLVIGTQGGEWVVDSDGSVITPTDISVRRHTTHGSEFIPPVRVDNAALFVQRQGQSIREFAFSFEADSFKAPDLLILSEHLTKDYAITEMQYQGDPRFVVWCSLASRDAVGNAGSTLNDGLLLGMTYLRQQDVVAWHKHPLGGSFAGKNYPQVQSMTVISKDADTAFGLRGKSQLWMSVRRTINGSTAHYIEFMELDHRVEDDGYNNSTNQNHGDAFYVDSGLSTGNTAGTDVFLISAATQADPVQITTSAAHGYSNGDKVRIVKVNGMTEINSNTYKVFNVAATTFTLADPDTSVGIDGTAFSTYANRGEVRAIVTSVSGLDHLEGETVAVFGDGQPQANQTVSSGAITLETAASQIHAGLPYVSKFKSLKIDAGAKLGTALNQTRRINRVGAILDDSGDFLIGRDSDTLLPEETPRDGITLFTGEHLVQFNGDYSRDPRIYIEVSDPTPFNLMGLVVELEIEEVV